MLANLKEQTYTVNEINTTLRNKLWAVSDMVSRWRSLAPRQPEVEHHPHHIRKNTSTKEVTLKFYCKYTLFK